MNIYVSAVDRSRKISPSDFALIHTNHKKLTANNKKVIEDNWNSTILHPKIFSGLNVVVLLENLAQKNLVESMLCVAGAKILKNEFSQPEVIITDSTKTEAIKSQFITELAKGTRIAPRIILAQQIPWAFVKPKRLQISEKSYEGPKIVLADLNHSARPNFLVMNDYPKLYLIPSNSKDYLLSPFVQPPTNLDVKGRPHNATQAQNNRHNFQVGPGNYGYCEICGVSYHDGTDHRNSAQHLSKVNNIETFAALDEFALSFCKLT